MKIKIFSGPSLESLESQINLFAESNEVMDVKILPVNKGPESYLAIRSFRRFNTLKFAV